MKSKFSSTGAGGGQDRPPPNPDPVVPATDKKP